MSALSCASSPQLGHSSSSREEISRCTNTDFSPVPWNTYFSEKKVVQIDNEYFCVYALSNIQNPHLESSAIVLLHGAGYSGLTWARFASLLFENYDCEIYAPDLRGHGETKTQSDYDLGIDFLSRDVVNLIGQLELSNRRIILMGHSMGGALAVHTALHLQSTKPVEAVIVVDVVEGSAMDFLKTMPTFLRNRPSEFDSVSSAIQWSVKTGHIKELESARVSMPGQLMCAATRKPATELLENLKEESPTKVASNVLSASGISEEEEDDTLESLDLESGDSVGLSVAASGISEEEEDDTVESLDLESGDSVGLNVAADPNSSQNASSGTIPKQAMEFRVPGPNTSSSSGGLNNDSNIARQYPPMEGSRLPNTETWQQHPYTWRIDLMKTEHNWRGWFEGLSKKFLSVSCRKLILATKVDRMDEDLTVAHAQGKFEFQFTADVGDGLHEDSQDSTASTAKQVANFLSRPRQGRYKKHVYQQ